MLDIIAHGDIAELSLNRPPANALNHELLRKLLAGIEQVLDDGAKGLILSGQDGMFSAGIDVPQLLGMDRAAIFEFWSLMFDSSKALLTSPVPVVAALAGHSPAGGAVLAAHCDYRIAVDGPYKIGFNEVQVGLPLPATILMVFEELVGPRFARQLAMQGKMMTMGEALEVGLVDELLAADQLMNRVLEFLENLLALPPTAMNRTRLTAKANLIKSVETATDVEQITESWFSAETQAAMQRLVESLKKN
jgi:enoyl-CoA hydratase/carnithine racemase